MESNLLDDFQIEQPRASKTLRFVNLLIDTIAFYVIALVLGGFIGFNAPDVVENENFSIFSYLISISLFLLYFSVFEAFTNGRTLGKLITGTRAVKEDGS